MGSLRDLVEFFCVEERTPACWHVLDVNDKDVSRREPRLGL